MYIHGKKYGLTPVQHGSCLCTKVNMSQQSVKGNIYKY